MRCGLRTLAILFGLLAGLVTAAAEDRPGDFDFYVLSLSWSPTYCLGEGRDDRIQCGGRPYAFVVHGLWPQYERGYPSDCAVGDTRVPRRTVDAMLDLMPSPSLIRHEWRKHGTCSGLDQRDYFALVREARAAVNIPPAFVDLDDPLTVSPEAIEAAFLKANPGLPRDGFAVICNSRRLSEVRVCMTRDLAFRPCPEVDRNACRRPSVVMPPVR
ncbi:MAG: ribonuclease T [Bosea sp.]|nr:ribonuclease T [Bosea sp. (in: a-proteobacteria)]